MTESRDHSLGDVVVREMTVADVRAALRVWYRSWVATYVRPDLGITRAWVDERWAPRLAPEGIAAFEESLRAGTHDEGRRYLVAARDGTIVGLAAPFVEPDRGQRVGAIYVDPDHVGLGVGTALMRAVLAAMDPARPVHLQVAAFNDRAIAFYRRFGFRQVPGSDEMYRGVMPEFWMRLDPPARPDAPARC